MRRRAESPASPPHGFTLIEVMIALTIMSVGVLSIGLAQLSALKLSTMSGRLSQAMYLAEEQMEIFRSMPWGPTFTTAAVNVPDPQGLITPVQGDSAQFNRSWTITPNAPPHGLTGITVTVVWANSNGARQTVALQGLRGP